MKEILKKTFAGKNLSEKEIFFIVDSIEHETANPLQIAALLGAISAKKNGATPEEIAFFAKALRFHSKKIHLKTNKPLIDVCGTGGDCIGTFNISTAVSFVVASFGIGVIKHGARSVSSACGSADVLEALGIRLDFEDEKIQNIFDESGMVFLYAPFYNTTMARIKKIRNSLCTPTLFNLLGPLVNPAKLDFQIVGVFDETKCESVCNSLMHLGLKEAMVVHSFDGLDELSTTSDNIVYHLKNNVVKKIKLPSLDDLGLKQARIEDILGGDVKKNADIILKILNGEKGPKRDIVLLNSAAALVVSNVAKDFKEGVEKAKQAIDSKSALKILERLRNVSG